jgi:hypothetical protein
MTTMPSTTSPPIADPTRIRRHAGFVADPLSADMLPFLRFFLLIAATRLSPSGLR